MDFDHKFHRDTVFRTVRVSIENQAISLAKSRSHGPEDQCHEAKAFSLCGQALSAAFPAVCSCRGMISFAS
jgi:hypothetical protein